MSDIEATGCTRDGSQIGTILFFYPLSSSFSNKRSVPGDCPSDTVRLTNRINEQLVSNQSKLCASLTVSSTCLSYCSPVYPSVRLSCCSSVHQSVCLAAHPSIHQSVCLAAYPSIHPSDCDLMFIRPSVRLSCCSPVYPSVRLSCCSPVYPSV